jgi:5-(carboxyamino)imidazole ribonucleotide synthase
MCVEVLLPGAPDREASGRAASNAVAVAQTLGVSGVLALEQFVSSDGRILVNELALRPHNTAHWTIEGAETSQFENHIRGVLDLPLGRTERTFSAVAMANVVGTEAGDPAHRLPLVLGNPTVHPHLYGKAWRPGRKLGHVTVCGDDLQKIRRLAVDAAAILAGDA